MPNFAQFVAYDLETTGLKPATNQIIEVGGFRFTLEASGRDLVVKEVSGFQEFIRPTMLIPAEATNVNHITNEMVENAPPAKEVLTHFTRFCGLNTILVAHNAGFDNGFLQKEIRENNLMMLKNPIFDSLKMARKITPEAPSFKLGKLANRFRRKIGMTLEDGDLHRALYDSKVLAWIFTVLLSKRFRAADLAMDVCLKNLEKIHGSALYLK